MRGNGRQETRVAARVQSRFGLLVGTLMLFWSAQLMGRDPEARSQEPGVRTQESESRIPNPASRIPIKDQTLAPGRRDEEDAPRHVLVVSIPDRKLALMENGRVLKVYSVAVGASVSPSPSGTLKIINKVAGPTYYHPGKVVGPGKSNPLGNRWMGLSQKGYGIHGTNVPSSIGKAASHGCIRMGRHDVEELFNLARVGDTVEIHGERDAQVAAIFGSPAPAVEVASSGFGVQDSGFETGE